MRKIVLVLPIETLLAIRDSRLLFLRRFPKKRQHRIPRRIKVPNQTALIKTDI